MTALALGWTMLTLALWPMSKLCQLTTALLVDWVMSMTARFPVTLLLMLTSPCLTSPLVGSKTAAGVAQAPETAAKEADKRPK